MTTSKPSETILVVDDVPDTLEVMKRNLAALGYRVFTAPGVAEAIELLDATPVDLIITDYKMPGQSGLDLIRHVRENLPDSEIMMITGYASIDGAVEAVKSGADEYLAKPFTDEELEGAVHRALEKLHTRRAAHSTPYRTPRSPQGIIGESKPMRRVLSTIAKAASTTATVLIQGESGTGKELVARAIHYSSARASAPFVPVNCGGIPETLIESELFGHVKGAFTGASTSRAGFFQTAHGGTLFLDEIGEFSLAMQVKLLRALQDRKIHQVGSSQAQEVDVRIVAATNKDLATAVTKGEFREDLYFRVDVIPIDLPPLRERDDDILLLAHHYVEMFAAEHGKSPPDFTDRALEALKNYQWPGNVRELENVMQRLVVMSDESVVDVHDLPSLMRVTMPRGGAIHRTLAEVEYEHVRRVLESVGGNKTRAAEILSIDRKTLREKLKAWERRHR
jgi:DNA-binding NtrC family response regulator